MHANGFDELREVLRQPDRRSLRRHLRRRRGAATTEAGIALRRSDGADTGRTIGIPGASHPSPIGRRSDPAGAAHEAGADRRRVPWRAVGSVAGIAVVVLGLGALRPRPSRPTEEAATKGSRVIEAPAADGLGAPTTTMTTAVRLWPAEPVAVVGNEVRTGGNRWQVGEPGDLVVVGDWDCDRLPSPAVVRPSTGEVAVFDRWPATDEVSEARIVGSAPDATSVAPGARCGSLVVTTRDGQEQSIPTTSTGATR